MRDDRTAGVAVVTGGSRGVGRGIAIALGSHGYTVYVTGRTQRTGESQWGGTIGDTATAITAAGGKGVAAHVDHRDDAAVKALFERVRQEAGRLDILVNNAALIHPELQSVQPFWDKPLAASVDLLDVGLRSGLVASYYAAPLLIETGPGLVAFTSAPGAVRYQYGAAYGAHKAGVHRAHHRRAGGRPRSPRRQRTHPHRRGGGGGVRDQRSGWPAPAVGARADVGGASQLPGKD